MQPNNKTMTYLEARTQAEQAWREGIDIIALDHDEYNETLQAINKGIELPLYECKPHERTHPDCFTLMGVQFVRTTEG